MDLFCDARDIKLKYGEYVSDVQRLLALHCLNYGAPEDFGSLTVKLDDSKAFRSDFAALVRTVYGRERGTMSADQMLTIVALASGGELVVNGRVAGAEISRTITMLSMMFAGAGTWAEMGGVAWEPGSTSPNNGTLPQVHDAAAATPERNGAKHLSASPSEEDSSRPPSPMQHPLESAIQEVMVQLGSIQSRMGRLEQVVDADLHAPGERPQAPFADSHQHHENGRDLPASFAASAMNDHPAPSDSAPALGRSVQEGISNGVSITGTEPEQAGTWSTHWTAVADDMSAAREVERETQPASGAADFDRRSFSPSTSQAESRRSSSTENRGHDSRFFPGGQSAREPLDRSPGSTRSAFGHARQADQLDPTSSYSSGRPLEARRESAHPPSAAERRRQENLHRVLANLNAEMKGRPSVPPKPGLERFLGIRAEQDRKKRLQVLAGVAAVVLVSLGLVLVPRAHPPAAEDRSSAFAGSSIRGNARENAGPNPFSESALVTAEDTRHPGGSAMGSGNDEDPLPSSPVKAPQGESSEAKFPIARIAGKGMERAIKEPRQEDLHVQRKPVDSAATPAHPPPPPSLGPKAGAEEGSTGPERSANDGPLTVLPAIMEKRLISEKKPVYPAEAQKQHLDGTVVLNAYITRDGTVRRMDVVQGEPVFLKSALAAVSWRRYEPYRVKGKPVEVVTQVIVKYPLQ